jgi:hypothetical protein
LTVSVAFAAPTTREGIDVGIFSRFSNRGFQERTTEHLIERTGCSPEVAKLAALAMHPFNKPPKDHQLEQVVRKLSRQFAAELSNLQTEDEVRAASRHTVQRFYHLAEFAGEEVLTKESTQALDEAGRPGESSLEIFGSKGEIFKEFGISLLDYHRDSY